VFAIGATVMSLDAVKKISVDDRKVIDRIAKQNQKKARAVIRKANEEAKKTIIKKGIQIVEPSKDMVTELTAAAAAVQTAMIGKVYSQEELDMVLKYRAEYRAKNAKPAAGSTAAATPAPATK
jgi:TRAP-type C4-dicarboxylate transport system substrate-binding protein